MKHNLLIIALLLFANATYSQVVLFKGGLKEAMVESKKGGKPIFVMCSSTT